MEKISRKGFLKVAAAAAMSGVTAGALTACNSASSSGTAASASGDAVYTPGTYTGTATGIGEVKVTMTFSETAITDVVIDASNETESIGGVAAPTLQDAIMAAQNAEIDNVSGATVTTNAVKKAAELPGVKAVLDVELNEGQMLEDVKIAINGAKPIDFFGHLGSQMPTTEEIVAKIISMKEGK